jgi:hypothetical protein
LAVASGLGTGGSCGGPRYPSSHRAPPCGGQGSRGCQPGSAGLACSGWGWGHQPQGGSRALAIVSGLWLGAT